MSNTLKLGNGKWATGKDTLLSFSDTNNNYKPLPFSFSRASSGTVVNKDGLIETVGSGEPRIDFKDNTKGALLLEPERRNKLTTSQDFSSFTKSGTVTTTTNYGISPSGQTDSTRVVFSSSNNAFYKLSGHSGNTETNSIYVKGTVGKTIKFGKGVTVNGGGIFTLNGEWQRLDFVSTVGNQFTINTYSSATARDIEIWGAQVEEGSYATSYIPTSGQANGVTRVADVCNNGGNEQVINSTEGVLYAEISAFEGSDDTFAISLNDGSSSNRIFLSLQTPESRYRAYSTGGGDVTFQGLDVTSLSKVAVRYSLNNFSLWVNGVKRVETLTYAGIPSNTLNNLSFDRNGIGELDFRGNVKDLKLYNTALTDQELIALTTI